MKKDMVQYEEFFKDFSLFMKEAIVSSTDQQEKVQIELINTLAYLKKYLSLSSRKVLEN